MVVSYTRVCWVRDGIDKILSLFLKTRELPGVKSWNRFRDFSRIFMGLEPCGKTCSEVVRFRGTGRVVLRWIGGEGRWLFSGRAPKRLAMSAVRSAGFSECFIDHTP